MTVKAYYRKAAPTWVPLRQALLRRVADGKVFFSAEHHLEIWESGERPLNGHQVGALITLEAHGLITVLRGLGNRTLRIAADITPPGRDLLRAWESEHEIERDLHLVSSLPPMGFEVPEED